MEYVSTQKKAALHTPLPCFLTPPTPTVTNNLLPPDDQVARSLKSLASQQNLRRKKRYVVAPLITNTVKRKTTREEKGSISFPFLPPHFVPILFPSEQRRFGFSLAGAYQ
jgi:hypothetical protein